MRFGVEDDYLGMQGFEVDAKIRGGFSYICSSSPTAHLHSTTMKVTWEETRFRMRSKVLVEEIMESPQPDASQTPTSTSTRTFHPFPRLPIELRLEIFKHALEPRTITAAKDGRRFQMDPLPIPWKNYAPLIPSLLHVNAEARQFALRFYKKRIWVYGNPKPSAKGGRVGKERVKRRYYYFREGFDEIKSPRRVVSGKRCCSAARNRMYAEAERQRRKRARAKTAFYPRLP